MVLKKSSIQRVKYGTVTKCEEIIKAIFENPKADQNTLFRKNVIFETPRLYFKQMTYIRHFSVAPYITICPSTEAYFGLNLRGAMSAVT